MCGVAALWEIDGGAGREVLLRHIGAMTASLRHRGPDGSGCWIDERAGVALGHTRLAIVDLSPAGAQPMASSDGRFVLSYNGEIYNAAELRRDLERRGRRFRGGSDTEVLVEGLAAWGIEPCLRRLIGMFAFALWDREARTMTLVRDRLGIKPLYWAQVGRTVLAGSELKTLRAFAGWTPEIDRDVLATYLRYRCVPAPRTIYREAAKLPPGHVLEIDRHGQTRLRQFWDPLAIVPDSTDLADAEAEERLDALLRDAVGRRMVADVPLGGFLSGGIDSSLVTALMQAQSSRPIRTFSIGFDEPGFDEAPHARAVAAHLGTDHTELYVAPGQALDLVPSLPEVFDEPFADASQIPTCLLAVLTRQHVTVALSGDGGDELFAGYERYARAEQAWQRLSRLPRGVRRLAAHALRRLPALDGGSLLCRSGLVPPTERIDHWASTLAAGDDVAFYRHRGSQWRDPGRIVRGAEEWRVPWRPGAPGGDFLARMQRIDLVSYLPNDVLTKVDRATMAVALEARVPILDHRVVEFALGLPRRLKQRDGTSKWLLRRVLDRYVPGALVDRPKAGFSVPLAGWLRGPLRDWAEDLLGETRLREEGFFEAAPVRLRWRQHLEGTRDWHAHLWTVLMFQAWLQHGRQATSRPAPLAEATCAAE
ncbi:asparagine synthase (glutamine-hydrolyzing) [Marinimicrococcus flavescens]|uniref:asparagine synthase (glutamine-hydrolyzing) n=1 Tax=Marinimicrococcus flavescens TaxID=3031815 RepID=A0AAP3V1G7_9PROT|nr:asparagine synthase (glutamine-hydrolyzing) [Marinimicrococcus flavescens]